ncbi:MAG: argininosuccinate lyase, partial [Candidatus Diapherotrites archaeon]
MKLWNSKGIPLNKEIEEFLSGKDISFDQKLIEFDCIASIAHAKMLAKIKVISEKECSGLEKELKKIIELNSKGKFKLGVSDEDCHTKIENYLVKKLGSTGKKIHSGRSRNDQILTALRLYSKQKLIQAKKETLKLCSSLVKKAEENEFEFMPGYTHLQQAMPSSVGLWLSAFSESLLDDIELLEAISKINNQNPLGSAAGYGTIIPIDREFTTNLLGFEKIQNNVLYCINSRGKIESMILFSLMQIMLDLNKKATDLLLFSTKEFDFVSLPDEFLTGSSIMPQKKNYDLLEIMKANSSKMLGLMISCISTINSLPSGYNRDTQLTKEYLMNGFGLCIDSIKVMTKVISNLQINKEKMKANYSKEIFAAGLANEMVLNGIPFREAHKKISKELEKIKKQELEKNLKKKKLIGGTGNLGLDGLKEKIEAKLNEKIKKNELKIENFNAKQ